MLESSRVCSVCKFSSKRAEIGGRWTALQPVFTIRELRHAEACTAQHCQSRAMTSHLSLARALHSSNWRKVKGSRIVQADHTHIYMYMMYIWSKTYINISIYQYIYININTHARARARGCTLRTYFTPYPSEIMPHEKTTIIAASLWETEMKALKLPKSLLVFLLPASGPPNHA